MSGKIYDMDGYRAKPPAPGNVQSLKSGGGDGTFDDMEARVAKLEKAFEKIDGKLDKLAESIQGASVRLANVEGRTGALPSAKDFADLRHDMGEIKGQIKRLPTFAKLSTLLGILVTLGGAIVAFFPKIVAWAHLG